MAEKNETTEETGSNKASARRTPGAIVVYSRHTPMFLPVPLAHTRNILGRTLAEGTRLPDERVSREHLEITRDDSGAATTWTLRDLESTNGTFIEGVRVVSTAPVSVDLSKRSRVVRMGNTILLLCDDIEPLRSATVGVVDGIVVGPTLTHALAAVERAARLRGSILLVGESGTGKELAARRFHAAGPSSRGVLVAVNCAAVPEGVAERLLFGARRGAFSGATENSIGYLQSADGGVLFLDEFGELSLEVQAKLLRVIEMKEVLAVGASRPQQVDVRFCFATNRNLRADVTAGKFRADLFYRVQTPQVLLPALRDRIEDIPWLVTHALTTLGDGEAEKTLRAHARFVETCMLRTWPGNVRELLSEVREAAGAALDQGAQILNAEHLREHAGATLLSAAESFSSMVAAAVAPSPPPKVTPDQLTREAIESSLEANGGNLAATARVLGVHRTQLYRRMDELEIPTANRKRDLTE